MALFRHTTKRHGSPNPEVVEDRRPVCSVTMADVYCEVKRALWHIFEQLDNGNTGSVQVSRLKVITSGIGLKLGYNKAEEILKKDGPVTSMGFEEFFAIIKEELLEKIEETPVEEETTAPTHAHKHINKKPTLQEVLNGLIKTCWTFCSFESARMNKAPGMTIENCMTLWRLFNFLSECDADKHPVIPVRMHPEEVALLLRDFIDYTGQRNKGDIVKQFSDSRSDSDGIKFIELLNMFEKDIANCLSRNDVTQCLNHLHEFYILNVLHRGTMCKRGYKVKNWKDRLFVLTTVSLKYYKDTEKMLKGEIVFDTESNVEVLPDRPSNKPHRFVIHTTKKPYEISAPDPKSKNEWVSAIQEALKCVGGNPDVQKEAAFQRCLGRINKRRQLEDAERLREQEAERQRKQQEELDEEKRKRLEDEELLRARQNELEEERKRRAEMEDKLLEEQRLREEEQRRLRELEEIKRELERLLEDERQAKKDEEIVRNLQARLLEEEFQRREELERLKQQQEEMLRAEREQNAVLVGDKRDQERSLREAKERLEQLERERAAAADKMQEASEKLLKAEKDRHIMEERVKLYKTKTSVGLNGPVQPRLDPMVTHRGHGAFCDGDFRKKGDTVDFLRNTEPDQKNNEVTDENANTKESDVQHRVEGDELTTEGQDEGPLNVKVVSPDCETGGMEPEGEQSGGNQAVAELSNDALPGETDVGKQEAGEINDTTGTDDPPVDEKPDTAINTDDEAKEQGEKDQANDNVNQGIPADQEEANEIMTNESEENGSKEPEIKAKTENNKQGFPPFSNANDSQLDFLIDLDTYN